MQRGIVKASIRAPMWEGRHFLSCNTKGGPSRYSGLSIRAIDLPIA